MAKHTFDLGNLFLLHQMVRFKEVYQGPVRFYGAHQPSDAIVKSKPDVFQCFLALDAVVMQLDRLGERGSLYWPFGLVEER